MTAWTVLTPIPLICNEILLGIQGLYPDVSFKFDPTLTYEESVKGVRAMRSAMDVSTEQLFPLFTYNLGVLKPYEVVRKQFPHMRNEVDPFFQGKDFKSRYCSFEIPWKWYYSDIIASKTFEVMFATETSINLVKAVTLEFTDIGVFEYQVVWDFMGLESVSYNKTNNLYMSCDGKCLVTGEFIMLADTPVKYIEEIELHIKEYVTRSRTMETATVNPSGITWRDGA